MQFKKHNYRIVISQNVQAVIERYKANPPLKERGGILLGKYFDDHLLVTDITQPKFFDISSMLSFIRSPFGHQERINKAWQKSQGKINYMGEWHTHPEHFPKPSLEDLNLLRETQGYKNVNNPTLMMIIGYSDIWIGVQPSLNKHPIIIYSSH